MFPKFDTQTISDKLSSMNAKIIKTVSYISLMVTFAAGTVSGETMESKLKRLEKAFADQAEIIARQQKIFEQQRREVESLRQQVLLPDLLQNERAGTAPSVQRVGGPAEGSGRWERDARTKGTSSPQPTLPELQVAQAKGQAKGKRKRRPVGEAPPKTEKAPPEVQAIPELGGVLTPKGTLVLEPSIQYSNSQVTQFTFLGTEIISGFLSGVFEIEDADRDLISPALTARYGVTNRFELELKVPYVHRDDTETATIPDQDPSADVTKDLEGSGLGDAEASFHYQLNRGLGGWPFFIANLRYKSTTGEGPFDVKRDSQGLESELSTGSGFHAIEPSVTVLYPSDPAVFFANVGYLVNIADDVDKTIFIEGEDDDRRIGRVDPGDTFRLSLGMAYAINEITSFTLGYKHDFIQKTVTEINGVDLDSSGLDVGALLLGSGFQVSKRVGVNLNLELGVTADAPDVVMTLRVPVSFDLF